MDIFNKEACLAFKMFGCVSQCPIMPLYHNQMAGQHDPNHQNCLRMDIWSLEVLSARPGTKINISRSCRRSGRKSSLWSENVGDGGTLKNHENGGRFLVQRFRPVYYTTTAPSDYSYSYSCYSYTPWISPKIKKQFFGSSSECLFFHPRCMNYSD